MRQDEYSIRLVAVAGKYRKQLTESRARPPRNNLLALGHPNHTALQMLWYGIYFLRLALEPAAHYDACLESQEGKATGH